MNTPRPAGPLLAALSGALLSTRLGTRLRSRPRAEFGTRPRAELGTRLGIRLGARLGIRLGARLHSRMRIRMSALLCALGLLLAGCASFSDATASFSAPPSLIPNAATVIPPEPGQAASSSQPSPPSLPSPPSMAPSTTAPTSPESSADSSPEPSESSSTAPSTTAPSTEPSSAPDRSAAPAPTQADPCAPPELPVVAVCLNEPWGLAPMPDGGSALVGERTTGKVFLVTPEKRPELITTIGGINPASGGLLGLALSPYYVEDGLIYAYASTASDARIMRFAAGQDAKAIVTGLPRSVDHWGGPIVFGDDGLLYVVAAGAGAGGTADAGAGGASGAGAGAGGAAGSGAGAGGAAALAGSILRYDPFGAPAPDNVSGTAVFASGLTDPTGICPLPGGDVGVIDHRGTRDTLIDVIEGGNYRSLESGDTLWTYSAGDEGAVDCAVSAGALLATARSGEKVTRVQMRPQGGFTGTPEALLDGEYGRLRTAVTGPGDLVWLTTRNKAANHGTSDGAGGAETPEPDPSDDRVLVLPPSGGSETDGGID